MVKDDEPFCEATLAIERHRSRALEPRWLRRPLLACVMFMVCSGCRSNPPVVRPAPDLSKIHLVVDAGSSGTRFCAFSVTAVAGGSPCTTARAVLPEVCYDMSESQRNRLGCGLDHKAADLFSKNQGLAPKRGAAEPEPSTAVAWFSEAIEHYLRVLECNAGTRVRIDNAVVFGTGGFRRFATAPNSHAYMQALWSGVRGVLAAHQIPVPTQGVRVIDGDEEARFGWLTVKAMFGETNAFTTLETGGATVQVATGTSLSDLRVKSFPTGQDETWTRAIEDKAFRSVGASCLRCKSRCSDSSCKPCVDAGAWCKPRVDAGASCKPCVDAEACARVMANDVFGPVRSFVRDSNAWGTHRFYALGAPWAKGVFDQYAPKEDVAKRQTPRSITLAQLREMVDLSCRACEANLADGACPSKPDPCFSLSFSFAYLRAVALPSDSYESLSPPEPVVVLDGAESWPRGAAIAPSVFPECRGE